MDHSVPERKSTSVHTKEGIKKGPETNQHDVKTAKTDRASPKQGETLHNFVFTSRKHNFCRHLVIFGCLVHGPHIVPVHYSKVCDRCRPIRADKQSPNPVQPPKKASDAGRGKNTFFLARWFGFGSK